MIGILSAMGVGGVLGALAAVAFLMWILKQDDERESGAGGDNPDV